ncbi:MAG: NUDIX domain-containing protein [Chloroflexi bacterium]|nr:NUDIX domain-containing protein [Chloroflexota bacterium]MXX82193.1 NUDIX domain-containing protein [Chloroflexota bacterium]MYA92106.1 NUDIX domain-containing protein [Chloroflexota bacterium]MYE79424.1 NUDIX domain-containing protein [Chloroflexota bacterium]MYH65909.1 NUDIX domain-containing protein [Chloroflexota bacterium]
MAFRACGGIAVLSKSKSERVINQRVRAILLTGRGSALLIKRVKPHKRLPYWVAPGGGVESWDSDLIAALERELFEELGARAIVLDTAFVLEHYKAGKQLEEHFFVCMLQDYDLSKRYGPEFTDPARGEYIPQEVPLDALALCRINIKTQQLRDWMLRNLDSLRDLQRLRF